MNRIARLALLSLAVALLTELPLRAQATEVPRTRTLPGIEDPAFPYAEPEEVGLSSERLERLGDEITEWVATGNLVGAELLIVKDGRAVFHEAYGWSDREEQRPVARNSIWSIKSMSKPFTAAATLMLAEEGRLSLHDPVSHYISSFAGDERTTIRHLLAHTSGYEGLGDTQDFHTIRAWVEDWAAEAPTAPFGEFAYSDFNYAALGHIIEAVVDTPADVFIEERIIEPLGLEETFTTFSPDAPWAGRVNSRYRWSEEVADYEKYWTSKGRQGWRFYPAAWGLWATAMDYARFMAMWLNKGRYEGVRILAEESVEQALRPHTPNVEDGYHYGQGWFVRGSPRADEVPADFGHGGFDGTVAFAIPPANAMVIFLTHSRGRAHRAALANRLGMLEIFAPPIPYTSPLVWAGGASVHVAALSAEEPARYVGTYRGQSPEGIPIVSRIWEEDGRLHSRFGELGDPLYWHFHLVPLGNDRFIHGRFRQGRLEAVETDVTIQFRVEDGQATGYDVFYDGRLDHSYQRADPARVRADTRATRTRRRAELNRPRIDVIVWKMLESAGIETARARSRALHASRPDSVRFGESLLNTLGYRLLDEGRTAEAVAVFEMNVEAYPEAANPYDSLADACRAAGRLEDALRNYERAVELAERQGHESLETYREKLERVRSQLAPGDTVRVAPPTREEETDRANVQAAFDAVRPGGTVLFAPGTYLLGAGVRLTVPDVTVLGHPEGTVLRGCDPEAFAVDASQTMSVVFACTGFYVQTERQTIRDLTFEYTWHGIVVGPYPATAEEAQAAMQGETRFASYPAGGQRIEGNTFRASPNGLRVLGPGEELSVVRDNDFIDVFHAIGIYGAPLHFLDNRVTVEEPGRVPNSRHPGSAILVSPGHTDCTGHVVAGNRVVGYPGAVYVLANRGQTCRDVEIRDNTIDVRRVEVPEAWVGATPTEEDSTMVGVPVTLMSIDRPVPWMPDAETEGVVENVVIEGNRLLGAEGLGILVSGSRNRISGNTIRGIERREPFPGITWIGPDYTIRWEEANGSAIWISPGSEQNVISGNIFEDIAAYAVVIEGDDNQVELRGAEDAVRDLGRGNRVIPRP